MAIQLEEFLQVIVNMTISNGTLHNENNKLKKDNEELRKQLNEKVGDKRPDPPSTK